MDIVMKINLFCVFNGPEKIFTTHLKHLCFYKMWLLDKSAQ